MSKPAPPAAPRPIDAVKTLTMTLPGIPLAKSLEKFTGRRTARTIAAARRLAVKPRTVKLPGNLLRQLFRLTGGWHPGAIQPSGETPQPQDSRYFPSGLVGFKLGDMEVVVALVGNSGYQCGAWIAHRGIWAGKIKPDGNLVWLDQELLKKTVAALGTAWPPVAPAASP